MKKTLEESLARGDFYSALQMYKTYARRREKQEDFLGATQLYIDGAQLLVEQKHVCVSWDKELNLTCNVDLTRIRYDIMNSINDDFFLSFMGITMQTQEATDLLETMIEMWKKTPKASSTSVRKRKQFLIIQERKNRWKYILVFTRFGMPVCRSLEENL